MFTKLPFLFFRFAYISKTHYVFHLQYSVCLCLFTYLFFCNITMNLSAALPCTGLEQFINNSHYYFGEELSMGFSVNLLKALLATVATFFFQRCHNSGLPFVASFGNQLSHHCKLMAVKLTFIMAFLFP